MRIPQIQVQRQPAKVEITTTRGHFDMQQPRAEVNIHQPQGKLAIEQSYVKVQINSYPSRYDLGIKNNTDFGKDSFQRARNVTSEAIGNIASEGDRMMRVENDRNVIAQIGLEKSTPPRGELGIKYIRAPAFDVVPPDIKINYTPHHPEIDVQTHKPKVQYHPGQVQAQMQSYGRLEINWKGLHIDQQA